MQVVRAAVLVDGQVGVAAGVVEDGHDQVRVLDALGGLAEDHEPADAAGEAGDHRSEWAAQPVVAAGRSVLAALLGEDQPELGDRAERAGAELDRGRGELAARVGLGVGEGLLEDLADAHVLAHRPRRAPELVRLKVAGERCQDVLSPVGVAVDRQQQRPDGLTVALASQPVLAHLEYGLADDLPGVRVAGRAQQPPGGDVQRPGLLVVVAAGDDLVGLGGGERARLDEVEHEAFAADVALRGRVPGARLLVDALHELRNDLGERLLAGLAVAVEGPDDDIRRDRGDLDRCVDLLRLWAGGDQAGQPGAHPAHEAGGVPGVREREVAVELHQLLAGRHARGALTAVHEGGLVLGRRAGGGLDGHP